MKAGAHMKSLTALTLALTTAFVTITAQTPQNPLGPPPERDPLNPAPARRSGEGAGPFKTLVIRGAILVDGSGAPPTGPVDIVTPESGALSDRLEDAIAAALLCDRQACAAYGKSFSWERSAREFLTGLHNIDPQALDSAA